MDLGTPADLITQAELQKGAELMARQSSAARLISALYMNALARRVAKGATIEPGPLAFDSALRIVQTRKPAASEALRAEAMKNRTG